MSNEISREDINLSRGKEDVVFISTDVDTSEIAEKDNPRQVLLEEMEKRGLETENVRVIGIFRDEFSLLLQENAKIKLNGEIIFSNEEETE